MIDTETEGNGPLHPPREAGGDGATVEVPAGLLRGLLDRLDRIETNLADVRRAVVEQPPAKDWYSVDEAAQLLGKSKFTIREHCRFGRIDAKKRAAGRGATSEWIISAAELARVGNEGLRPLTKHVPDRL